MVKNPHATDPEPGTFDIRPLGKPGDLGWVVLTHGEIYAEEFGWNARFETLVAHIVADYGEGHDPTHEAAWIAELDGKRIGCVFCVRDDETTARLRILLVHPDGRGHGVGRRLVETCLDFARNAGYSMMKLWTNDVLASARTIYLEHGFRLIDQKPHNDFGVPLVGQNYEMDLTIPTSPEPLLPVDGGSGLISNVNLEDKDQIADSSGTTPYPHQLRI